MKLFLFFFGFSFLSFAEDPGLKAVKDNYFNSFRELKNYDDLCHLNLKPFLKNLEEKSLRKKEPLRVLDSGCGAGFALVKAQETYPSLQFTGLTYRIEPSMRLEMAKLSNVDLITDNFIEDLSSEEILGKKPKFSLILDIFGPYSYSPRVIDVINKYLSMLEPEGEIFIVSLGSDRRYNRERGLAVVFEDNTFIDFSHWLLLNGVNLELFKDKHLEFMRIKAAGSKALKPLALEYNYPHYPPARDFMVRAAKL